jgi:hypothetical protein
MGLADEDTEDADFKSETFNTWQEWDKHVDDLSSKLNPPREPYE